MFNLNSNFITGTKYSEDHEAVISMTCFVVGGIQSLFVNSDGCNLTLGQGKGSAKLFVPPGAIPQGQELQIRYAVLLNGPFFIPNDYDIVSSVLYINYDTSMMKTPLRLHLNHWYAGRRRQTSLSFVKAPHVTDEDGGFHFVNCCHGSFPEDEQFAVLELKNDLCFVAVAVMNTGKLSYPCKCELYLLKKKHTSAVVPMSFRVYVTYEDSAWNEVRLMSSPKCAYITTFQV